MARLLGLALFLTLAIPAAAIAEDPPVPSLDRVDHARPDAYTALLPTMGSADRIRAIASSVTRPAARETLRAIGRWIDAHLRYDANAAYEWRDVDRMIKDGTYGGCADHALLFGAIARAAGIPTVWLKSMDLDWIAEFQRAPETMTSWRGHVFLEVHLDGRWALLDATTLTLHEPYDPARSLVPGPRLAYDRGGDPFALVLSSRWKLWKEQTRRFFAPLPGRGLLPEAYIAADSPTYQALEERCRKLGARVAVSFNTGFEEHVPRARGKILIVTYVDGRLVFSRSLFADYLPLQHDEIQAALAERPRGIASRNLPDGTRVILLYARSKDEIRRAMNEMRLE